MLAAGQMESVCLKCAIQEAQEKEAHLPPTKPFPIRETYGKTDGTKLARVELFNADGSSRAFLALPPLPTKPVSHTLRKEKKKEFSVMVFRSQDTSSRLMTEPRIFLYNNLNKFRETGQPLRFFKVPSFWSPFTGRSRIEVPNEDVVAVENDGAATIVKLKDGGYIRLTYR